MFESTIGRDLAPVSPPPRGRDLPDLPALRTVAGSTVTLEPGLVTVVTFFTHRCPADLCPRLVHRVADLGERLRPELRGRVRRLAITLDPERDTAAALRGSGELPVPTGPGGGWQIASGSADEIETWAETFGVVWWARVDGSVGHSLTTAVIGPRGRLVDRFPGIETWSVDDLVGSVAEAATR